MAYDRLKIISGNGNLPLAESIAKYVGIKLVDRVCDIFPDGEINITINESVRGDDVFIVQSTQPNKINDQYMELWLLAETLQRCGADRITWIAPYCGYTRQDRPTGRQPLSMWVVANNCKGAGITRYVFIDLHNPALQGLFGDAETIMDLSSKYLFANELRKNQNYKCSVLAAPDAGGVKRTDELAKLLGLSMVYVHKDRDPVTRKSVPRNIVGDVAGKNVVIVEDLIATGGTLADTIKLCKEKGADSVIACASHALLIGEACSKLESSGLDELIITDTLPVLDEARKQFVKTKLTELSWSEKLAKSVILSLHKEEPTTSAFEE